jgi:hypothetical protein
MYTCKEHVRALPFAGARLVRFSFCGNGKDSEVTIEAEGARKVVLPLSYAEMDIDTSGPMTIRTRGRGDTQVEIEIVPLPQQPVIVDEAIVVFTGDDDDCDAWDEAFRQLAHTGWPSWCVTLRLRLATTPPVPGLTWGT